MELKRQRKFVQIKRFLDSSSNDVIDTVKTLIYCYGAVIVVWLFLHCRCFCSDIKFNSG